jgi:hypothetical protein
MAGLTIRDDRGRPTTAVYTDRLVSEIDQAQYDNDRGPCLDAARTHIVFEVQDTRRDDRWPEFAAAAARHGVRSTLSMPVVAADDGIGALNFYDRRVSYFDPAKRGARHLLRRPVRHRRALLEHRQRGHGPGQGHGEQGHDRPGEGRADGHHGVQR